MAAVSDLEKGVDIMKEPLIWKKDDDKKVKDESALFMVLLSTAVAVSGSFVFGTCVGYSSPAQLAIMEELKMSYSQYSIFGSILTIGAMLGAITCGRIADFAGRKGAMRLSSIICIFGWLAIYLALKPIMLYLGRFFTGYGIGILSYVVPVFIGEITPNRLRGALSSLNQLFIVIGLSMIYVIGAFVGWRTLTLTAMVPSVVLFLGLFFIPESPRWLAMAGRPEEFEAALRKLRGPKADLTEEIAIINDYIVTFQTLPKVTVMSIFDRANFRAVIIAVGLMAFQQFVGINGIVFYSNNIFRQAGEFGAIYPYLLFQMLYNWFLLTGFNPSLGSIIYAVLQVVVTAAGACLIDRAGRRPLLLMSATGLLLGSLLLAFSFLLKAHELAMDTVPLLAVSGVMVYIASFSIGMGAGPWLIMSEVFPLHMKGIGGGLVTLMNWFGSWVVSYSFNFLMVWSSYGTFFVDAFMCFLAIIFIYKLLPETKGRSLEEIHASLNS